MEQAGNEQKEGAPQPVAELPQDDLIGIEDFAKVKLRIGQVLSAEPVPKSTKLLKFEIDLGPELGKRQILSGIAQYYTPEEMIGKRIVVLVNLKPRAVMGLESQGMLLAAASEDGTALTLVEPARDVPIGSVVR